MARTKHGIYGPIIGKLGGTVHYIRLGQPMVRMLPHKSNKPASAAQKGCRSNMSIVMEFVKAVNMFTNQGFKVKSRSFIGKTAQNMAVSYNMLNAIQGVSPDHHLDYSKILVSEGKIVNPADIRAELDGSKIKYTWDPNTEALAGSFPGTQQAMLLAYFPETKEAQMLLSSARRKEGIDFLDIHVYYDYTGAPTTTYAETYIAFIADDRESVSNSVYTGRIELF